LEGEAIQDIDEFLTQGTVIEKARTDQVYTTVMMQLYYYMGDLTRAAEMARQNLTFKDNDFPFFYATIYSYWRGLVYFALVQQDGKGKCLRQARRELRTLKKYVGGGLINCHYMLLLLEAEDAATSFLGNSETTKVKRNDGNSEKGSDRDRKSIDIRGLYDRAIRLASRSGFPQAGALAINERAGLFSKRRCRCESTTWWTSVYLITARDTYTEWGAQVKAQQLEKLFGDWMTDENLETKTMSSNIKGRARFNRLNSSAHHSDDLFYLSGDEASKDSADSHH
jgi:hypothetical protein